MAHKTIQGHLQNTLALDKLLPHLWGKAGSVFTKEDLIEVRDVLLANKVPAATCVGTTIPCEVILPGQNTALGLTALGTTIKISRGPCETPRDKGR